jgi:hypothetical protein
VVAGKGEIRFALADGPTCNPHGLIQENQPQDFTITGGTGSYEGVSGSGTAERVFGVGGGIERWTGTLLAPGTEFDVTPPRLNGATTKTVRAPRGQKRVHVIYRVTASDAVDGAVPVTCKPRSGSRFPLGRTRVTCSAMDKSANTATASFRVTVRANR